VEGCRNGLAWYFAEGGRRTPLFLRFVRLVKQVWQLNGMELSRNEEKALLLLRGDGSW